MVGEQAALRRVATLVARGVSEEEVFTTVAEEAGRLLSVAATGLFRFESDETVTLVGGWGQFGDVVQVGLRVPLGRVDVASQVARTGKFARLAPGVNGIDPPAVNVRPAQLREVAGSPIVAAGRVWGTLVAESVEGGPLPRDVEQRLTEFAELVATATANSKARVELARLANEQAALRRIATLVAKEAPAEDLFAQVAEDVANLLGPEVESAIFRYEPDHTVTCLAVRGEQVPGGVRVGSKVPVGGDNATARVYRERRPVRFDDYSTASGVIADRAKRHGFLAAIGCPILVQGRLWGMIFVAHGVPEPFPLDTEQRLTRFTELLATAIANTEAHAELARLANEQAALRRVATQVARETPTTELFAKVAEEVANLLGSQVDSAIVRYEPGETVTLMALQTQLPPGRLQVGMRLALGASDVTASVYRDRRPVRTDYHDGLLGAMAEYIRDHHISTTIGCPILVQGRLWGAMIVSQTQPEPFPADTEQRITQFTALVATAIANAQAQSELQRLLDEQAVLRRLAMLVAQGARPAEVFDAVVVELHAQIGAAEVGLMRVDSRNELTILAYHGQAPGLVSSGMRLKLDGDSASARVLRTGRSARHTTRAGDGTIAELARRGNVAESAGAPIVVDGKVWGVLTASWRESADPPPADVEQRLAEFAELVDTTIANADSRTQLTASRARVLSAADEARRRVVRDLHDGAQQRLVHTIITLKLAQRAFDQDPRRARSLLSEALGQAEHGNADLRELAHGILPSVLARGGLRAGVDSVVARLDVPVDVEVTSARLPPEIEASGYFIIAEALTNVVKHARATKTTVRATICDSTVQIEVRDDGVGGADTEGHGLTGLSDRVAALGGSLRIDSPDGRGTALIAQLPVPV